MSVKANLWLQIGLAFETKDFDPVELHKKGFTMLTDSILISYDVIDRDEFSSLKFYPIDTNNSVLALANVGCNFYGANASKSQILLLCDFLENEIEFCNCIQKLDENTEYAIYLGDIHGQIDYYCERLNLGKRELKAGIVWKS